MRQRLGIFSKGSSNWSRPCSKQTLTTLKQGNAMRLIIILTAVLTIVGCATAKKMNRLSLGMTKKEVIAELGDPTSTSATDGVEYLNYRLSETSDHDFYGITTPYYVRLIDGKVDSYGRMGDFDSSKIPTKRLEIRTSEAD